MSLSGRAQLIEAHLYAGRSLCPFAGIAIRRYYDTGERDTFPKLVRAAEQFALTAGRRPAATLIIVAPDDPPFDRGRQWAIETFLRLDLAAKRLVLPTATARELVALSDSVARMIADPEEKRRLHIVLTGYPLFVTGLGPQYPAVHPRYLPATALVAVWQPDVWSAQKAAPRVVETIRARMLATHGSVYDADDLWLPLPPRAPDAL